MVVVATVVVAGAVKGAWNGEYGRARGVGGKLNLAQDVTAPGSTGASVR